MKRYIVASVVLVGAVAYGCGVSDAVIVQVGGDVDTLSIVNQIDSLAIRQGQTPAVTQQLNLEVGDTARLTVSGFNALGQNLTIQNVSWTSSNPQVATVTAGVVVAETPGNTNIVASLASVSAVVPTVVRDSATVPPPPPPPPGSPALGSLNISPGSVTLTAINQTQQLTVQALDSLGNPRTLPTLTWSTSSAAIATVSASGLVTLRGFGTATISVSASSCTGDNIQVVGQAPPPPGGGAADVIYAVDWSHSTGRTTNALTDGQLIQEMGFPSNLLLETVALAPLGAANWPVNGLRISFGNQNSSLVGSAGRWAAPPIGQTIYFRFLAYNGLPNNSQVFNEHGQQSNIGAISHGFQFFSPENGIADLGFFSVTGNITSYHARIPANTPLRIEWALTRLTGTRARIEIRIYNERVSTTTPTWRTRDFLGNWGTGPAHLETAGADFSIGNETDGFRSYTFGASGSSNGNTTGLYITGFAVCRVDWCGPYQLGEN